MKSTGIVRRIDELGRVVIPMEIRRTMRIHEGDQLEILVDEDGKVIFRKYSPVGKLSAFAEQISDTLNKTTGRLVAVADNDVIIAANGAGCKGLIGKRMSGELERIMKSRQLFTGKKDQDSVPIIDKSDKYTVDTVAPIIVEGDLVGCIILGSCEDSSVLAETDYKLIQMMAYLLGKQMEM